MSRAVIILNGADARSKAKRWVDLAPINSRVEFKRARRTLDQNAALWARLTDIAEQVEWYGQKLSAEDWKDIMSASLRKARVVPGLDAGSFVPLGMRTSDMTKEEMSDLLELIAAFGAERGVIFHDEAREAEASDSPAASR